MPFPFRIIIIMASFQEQQQQLELDKLLADLSVADFWHDFGKEPKYTKTAEKIINNKYLNKGLPVDSNIDNIRSNVEHELFNSSIWLGTEDTYKKILNGFITEITTINTNKMYKITNERIKRKENSINYKKFNINDITELLVIPNKSAFVVDATSLTLKYIFTKPPKPKKNPKKKQKPDPKKEQEQEQEPNKEPFCIYFLMSPEIVNDPAPKSRLESFEFGNSVLIPCEPLLLDDTENVYTYDYNSYFPDPYHSFFTKYRFSLTELVRDSINTKLYTFLKVTDVKNSNNSTTSDKTEENDINNNNSAKIVFKQIQKYLPSISSYESMFYLNANIQKKRAGDWLQVLFCLSVKTRYFRKLNDNENKDISEKIKDVFFVTHDIIAMTFALLMGVNVLFTTKTNIYSFKLQNHPPVLKTSSREKPLIFSPIRDISRYELGLKGVKRNLSGELLTNMVQTSTSISDIIEEPNKRQRTRTRTKSGGGGIDFHPLLPIHIILIGFNELILDNIENSLDYDICVWYCLFLENIYYYFEPPDEKVTKPSHKEKYYIGIGLRELLFTDIIFNTESYQVEIGTYVVLPNTVIIPDYSLIYGMNTQLSYYVCGKIPENREFFEKYKKYSEDGIEFFSLFKTFLSEIITKTNSDFNEGITIDVLIEKTESLSFRINNILFPNDSFPDIPPYHYNIDDRILPPPIPVGGRSKKMKTKTKKTNQKNKKKKRTTRKKNK